jgi:Tfp pilus assembly protein PilN
MKFINLLPPNQLKDNRLELISLQLRNFWIWVSISLLILFGLTFIVQILLNNEIESTDNQIVILSSSLQSADNQKLEDQVIALNRDIKNIESLSTEHYYWSKALVELGNIIPAELTIDALALERKTGEVKIRGVGETRTAVLNFWTNLNKSEMFDDVNFPLANLESARETSFSFAFFVNQDLIKQE